jgi:hypothetical protein
MGLPWLSGLTRVPSLLHISTLKCKITKFYKFKIERILEAVLSNSLQYFCSRKGEDKSYSQWKTTEKHSLSTVFGLVPRRKKKEEMQDNFSRDNVQLSTPSPTFTEVSKYHSHCQSIN